jgi:excisionase family DNA binding protein
MSAARPDVAVIDPDAWFSTGGVAALLGVDPKAVVNWHRRGRLPATLTTGGHRRFRGADVARFLAGTSGLPGGRRGSSTRLFGGRFTREELEDLYVRQGLTQREIGARFGIHQGTVWSALRTAGIPARPRGSWLVAAGAEVSREILEDLYGGQGLSLAKVAERLGVSPKTARARFVRFGIPLRSRDGVDVPHEVLEHLYVTGGLGVRAVGRHLGISCDQVRAARHRHGIAAHPPGRMPDGRVPSREELEDLYLRQGLSSAVIAERFGVNQRTLKAHLGRHGISRRGPAAAATARYASTGLA